jgi:hypothetical protein
MGGDHAERTRASNPSGILTIKLIESPTTTPEEQHLNKQDTREGEEKGNKREKEKRERKPETREKKDQKTNKEEKTLGIQSAKVREKREHKTSTTQRDCSTMTGNTNNKNTQYCHFLDGPPHEELPKTTKARRRKKQEEWRRQGARNKKEQSRNNKSPSKNTDTSNHQCQCLHRPIKKNHRDDKQNIIRPKHKHQESTSTSTQKQKSQITKINRQKRRSTMTAHIINALRTQPTKSQTKRTIEERKESIRHMSHRQPARERTTTRTTPTSKLATPKQQLKLRKREEHQTHPSLI